MEAPKASTPFSFLPATPQAEQPKPSTAFSFNSTTPAGEPPKALFPIPEPKSTLSGTSGLFSFGQASEPSKPVTQFSLGVPNTPATPSEVKPSFSFGPTQSGTTTPVGPPPGVFSFGSTTTPAAENKPFSFGANAARPQTPPREANEMSMDDSPERSMGPRSNDTRPTLTTTGFSFGDTPQVTPTTSSPFGQPAAFAFSGNTTSNPFNQTKPDEGRNSPFSFSGPPQTATGAAPTFAFGAQPDTLSAPRPATTGSFSFSSSASTGSNTGAQAPFAFGSSPSQNGSNNPFAPATSAPGSPSGFGAPQNGFSFNTGNSQLSVSNAPFQFSGSQPVSPAVSTHSLPGSGFAFSAPQIQASTSGGGAAAFTMGAAPTSNPSTQGGRRPVKGLPRGTRRQTGGR
ncbi:hypothetical protein DL96DRAFT_1070162 [Flagelloscypha sp. PMI_526]|nr:hypothetical protein DL96DRAFT_1070162 [Flagelloscypha sp. PMI_526]